MSADLSSIGANAYARCRTHDVGRIQSFRGMDRDVDNTLLRHRAPAVKEHEGTFAVRDQRRDERDTPPSSIVQNAIRHLHVRRSLELLKRISRQPDRLNLSLGTA